MFTLKLSQNKEIIYRQGIVELFDTGEYCTIRPFPYVHQLQNLYFAITGEELQYNK